MTFFRNGKIPAKNRRDAFLRSCISAGLKWGLASALSFGFLHVSYAQVSFGGVPPTMKTDRGQKGRAEIEILQVGHSFDDASLREEEEQAASLGMPPRLAINVDVDYNPRNSGNWQYLPDSTPVWRLALQLPGALAVMVSYRDFYLPEGTSLYLYTPDYSKILGAYQKQTHPQGGSFSTEMLPGDAVVFELVMPQGTGKKELESILGELRLQISGLAYCYNAAALVNFPGIAPGQAKYGESSWCTINVNCEEGADWQVTKKSVCRMLMLVNGGWYLCTGTLMNNTAQNIRPFIASAYHCLSGGNPEDIDFGQWQFLFWYESPGCDDAEPLDAKTMVGCHYRAGIPMKGGSDGLLLELCQPIPEEWDVYYNGWDRRDILPEDSTAVGIHHPAGDIKKISAMEHLGLGQWPVEGEEGAMNAHIILSFAQTANGTSVTEGGSSGSGLFNADHALFATLTGGSATCDKLEGKGYYGRLFYHWDRFGKDSTTQFAYWLDPVGSGAETLGGTYIDPSAPRMDLSRRELDPLFAEDPLQPSPADTFYLKASNLEEEIRIWADAPFEVSANGLDFGRSTWRDGSGLIYVRYNPGEIRRDTAYVCLWSLGCDTARVKVTGSSCRVLRLSPEKLEYAYVDQPYSCQFEASGSDAEYAYEIVGGSLPQGMSLSPDGLLEGTPTQFGLFDFDLRVSEPLFCDQVFHCSLYVVCDVVEQFPYHESFEEGRIPDCWTEEYEEGNVGWQFGVGVGNREAPVNTARDGSCNAFFKTESYAGYATKLVTPQLDLQSVVNPVLRFSFVQPAWVTDQDEMSLYWKNSATAPWQELIAFEGDIPQWTDTVVSLPDPSSEYFIAFRVVSRFGFGAALDNVRIEASEESEEESGNIAPDSPEDVFCNNPVWENLRLEWKGGELRRIRICDLAGHRLMEYSVSGQTFLEIPMGGLPSGIYLLRAEGDKGETVKKIFKL